MRQSPLTRGTFWTTFGQSPLRDKVLRQGAQFGPHLVKIRSETKTSNKGHHFFATFGQCPLCDKFFQSPIIGIILWPHLPEVRCVTFPPTRGNFSFYAKIWPTQAAWYATLISHCSFFWMPIAWASHPTLPTRPFFPKRPNITGAPGQVFKFDNFLDCLIGGIKANTISAIGIINPGSLCTCCWPIILCTVQGYFWCTRQSQRRYMWGGQIIKAGFPKRQGKDSPHHRLNAGLLVLMQDWAFLCRCSVLDIRFFHGMSMELPS